jgi:hypothetical protein
MNDTPIEARNIANIPLINFKNFITYSLYFLMQYLHQSHQFNIEQNRIEQNQIDEIGANIALKNKGNR